MYTLCIHLYRLLLVFKESYSKYFANYVDSMASRAGIQPNDLLVAINSQSVSFLNADMVAKIIRYYTIYTNDMHLVGTIYLTYNILINSFKLVCIINILYYYNMLATYIHCNRLNPVEMLLEIKRSEVILNNISTNKCSQDLISNTLLLSQHKILNDCVPVISEDIKSYKKVK